MFAQANVSSFMLFRDHHVIVAVCMYCYVITLGLHSKYDMMVTISDLSCNPRDYILEDIVNMTLSKKFFSEQFVLFQRNFF